MHLTPPRERNSALTNGNTQAMRQQRHRDLAVLFKSFVQQHPFRRISSKSEKIQCWLPPLEQADAGHDVGTTFGTT
jgi:hypothetical protein